MFVFDLFCITLCPFYFFNHLEEKERAGCFAFVVLRMSCYCIRSVTLPHGSVGCLWCVIVVFPDHNHFVFEKAYSRVKTYGILTALNYVHSYARYC